MPFFSRLLYSSFGTVVFGICYCGGLAFLVTLYLVFGTAVVLNLFYNYLVMLFWFMVSRGYYSYFGNAVLGVW